MIDRGQLWQWLDTVGLGEWRHELRPLLDRRLDPGSHGDLPGWLDVLKRLPADNEALSRDLLLELAPWRKGPFQLGGIRIDAEWRSDWKWARLADAVGPLDGRNVLDVGCGNGYYALRMRDAGAAAVLGIDPTVLYCVQFLAVAAFLVNNIWGLKVNCKTRPDRAALEAVVDGVLAALKA